MLVEKAFAMHATDILSLSGRFARTKPRAKNSRQYQMFNSLQAKSPAFFVPRCVKTLDGLDNHSAVLELDARCG